MPYANVAPYANVGPPQHVYDLFDDHLDWDPVYDAVPAAVPTAYGAFQPNGRNAIPSAYSGVPAPPAGRPPLRELPVILGAGPAPPAAAGLRLSGAPQAAGHRLIPMREDLRQLDREHPSVGHDGVVYMQEARQRKHLIHIGRTLTRARNGLALDTAQMRETFRGKVERNEAHGHKPGHATLFYASQEMRDLWARQSLIWVCLPGEGGGVRFFSAVGKTFHVHHSSLAAGADVIGAGEWIVRDGALKAISANSGHYRPDLASLVTCVRLLTEALRADTVVLMWDTVLATYVHRPVREFLDQPGGEFKVHRDAPR